MFITTYASLSDLQYFTRIYISSHYFIVQRALATANHDLQ